MSCPVFTSDPRSTLIESTNAVTLGKTATTSYGCSSPGKRTVMASFLDATFVVSTEGVAAVVPCVPALVADEPEFEPHEMQKPMLLVRTRQKKTLIRFIELLHGANSDSPCAGLRKRSGDPQDQATEISPRLVPGPWKTPAEGSAVLLQWRLTVRQSLPGQGAQSADSP